MLEDSIVPGTGQLDISDKSLLMICCGSSVETKKFSSLLFAPLSNVSCRYFPSTEEVEMLTTESYNVEGELKSEDDVEVIVLSSKSMRDNRERVKK